MCAAESPTLVLKSLTADILDIVVLRNGAEGLTALLQSRGTPLPQLGRIARHPTGLILAVRPARWLLLSEASGAGEPAPAPGCAYAPHAACVDLSSALIGLVLGGVQAAELLKRGCRVDLAERTFPAGSVAATTMAQVSVALARLGASFLLLTPATTGQHLYEWLLASGKAFGLREWGTVTVKELSGETFR